MTTTSNYAGFWRRAIANIIDMAILTIVSIALFSIIQTTNLIQDLTGQIIMAIYFIGFIASHYQATPGKILLKIKIESSDKDKLSLKGSIIRYLVWSAPTIPMLFFMLTPQYADGIETLEMGNQIIPKKLTLQMSLSTILTLIWSLIWFLPIAFTKDKKGIHDMICQTRAYRT